MWFSFRIRPTRIFPPCKVSRFCRFPTPPRQAAHLRQLRHVADNAEADPRHGSRLRHRTPVHQLPAFGNLGGAGYLRYQFFPRWAVSGRPEYLEDQGGLFSGVTQALKDTTVTLEQKLLDGFLLRQEWRRDFSNQPYFYTDLLGVLKREQNTATMGLVWWFGPKKAPW